MGIRGRMITLLCAVLFGIGTAAYAGSFAIGAARAEQGAYTEKEQDGQPEEKDRPEVQTLYTEEAAAEKKFSYVLRQYRGNVAVFYGEDQQPIFETEIAVSGLRQTDAEKLQKGIMAASYEEVLRLLEDFNS